MNSLSCIITIIGTFDVKLVILSYCISWLGAYTCTQVAIHAKSAASKRAKWWWTFLGSVVFGFSAIWCMHFGEFAIAPEFFRRPIRVQISKIGTLVEFIQC